jgi:hypothetical protein
MAGDKQVTPTVNHKLDNGDFQWKNVQYVAFFTLNLNDFQ